MAHVYIYSGAGGAGTGADWANAYTTLQAAFAAKANGDNFWAAHDHAETQGSTMALTPKGIAGTPSTVMCVNRAGSVPPVSADLRTTATITTTGAFGITIAGSYTYFYGLTFNVGSGAVANTFAATGATARWQYYLNCLIAKLGTTASTIAIVLTSQSTGENVVVLDNTAVQFGNTGDRISIVGGVFVWRNTAAPIAGAIIPTSLFAGSSASSDLILNGIDFSALGAGSIFTALPMRNIVINNCKLGASTVISGNMAGVGLGTKVVNCDSGDTNYRSELYAYPGTLTTETTIVRTGGASDGTTSLAWKIVTGSGASWLVPFESLPIPDWIDTPGAKTVSIYGYWDNAVVPTNAQIWIVADYLGTAGATLGLSVSSGTADFLAAGTNIPSDSSAWGGGDTTTRFKMSVSLTTTKKGPISVRVFVAASSQTFYIDPKIEIV